MFNQKASIKHFKVFGTILYINDVNEKCKKFDARSKKVIIVVCDGESSNYRFWDQNAYKISISSDVNFNENSIDTSDQTSQINSRLK